MHDIWIMTCLCMYAYTLFCRQQQTEQKKRGVSKQMRRISAMIVDILCPIRDVEGNVPYLCPTYALPMP